MKNKRIYLQRVYYRHVRTGCPLVREYVVEANNNPGSYSQRNMTTLEYVGEVTYDITDSEFPKDWVSPYSTKGLTDAKIRRSS